MSDQIIYEKLISLLKSYHPSNDFSLVEKAYRFAKEAHEGQHRKSGEPYVIHPLEVAVILAELELDIESITAGILHDILEDTDHTFEELAGLFGEEVARLVDGVTKLGKINFSSNNKELQKEEIQAENYRKMFLAMAQDIRVILIKLADRLHNMRTLRFMPPEKQKEKANETLHIYAPLAHRLGISKIKVELDDLALRYLEPEVYYDLAEKIAKRRIERIEYVERIVKEVKTKLDEAGIKATVEGRPKHFFSIYKKMIGKNVTLDQIYDLFAIRAIVETVKDCYGVLGIVHEMYKPIPGRFKDYIAMPKPNMYQSLHTSLIGPEGEPFEVQIRTREMHKVAEYGIAAHWRYKEGKKGTKVTDKSQDKTEEKLAWLRQILEWQREMSDNKEFLDALKMDLDIFSDQVYAFTPKGDVISLPYGSTPIDFAYMIHSAVGNKMVGAKVNGKI
ncbi:MAG TPA: RelA/SpoT family protein, partial [Defluviitaleaceae bacterium]|nr:RelA/SpoT family protein [Defluviitaleaceae bacterium]